MRIWPYETANPFWNAQGLLVVEAGVTEFDALALEADASALLLENDTDNLLSEN